ncbi:MAG TPA: uroporphyrinogen-III synthase [Chitinophagaceae bacterium]
MSRGTILSTKELDEEVRRELGELGFVVEIQPFISIEFTEPGVLREQLNDIAKPGVLVFTSANAVEAVKPVASLLTDKQIFCISGRTRAAAEKVFGKARIAATADYGGMLAAQIIAAGCRQVLFFCSNIRRDELPELLRNEGIRLQEIVAYRTLATPVALNKNYNAVMFFSPSAADSFFSKNQPADNCVFFAIGNTTAEEIRKHSANTVISAEAPTQEEMVNAVKTHLK